MAQAKWLTAPDETIVFVGRCGDKSLADLRRDVGAVVGALQADGVSPGRVRQVASRSRYRVLVGCLAAWEVGEVVGLPAGGTPGAVAALGTTGRPLQDVGEGIGFDAALATEAPASELVLPGAAQTLVLMTTSGSTDHPKRVRKTTRQLVAEADTLARCFGLEADDVVLATVPPSHLYGLLFGLLLPLRAGAATVDAAPAYRESIEAALRTHGATRLVTIPAHLKLFHEASPGAFETVQTIFSSGAPLPKVTADGIHALTGLPVREVLGSTETGGIAHRSQHQGPLWTSLPGVQVQAAEDGVLLLRSPFLPGDAAVPLRCDDRIAMAPDGRFEFLGRVDDVVKVAGNRVSLRQVGAAIAGLDGVSDAMVVAHATDAGEQRLWAAVVSERSAETIRAALRGTLSGVAIPRIAVVDALPRTAMGKVRRADVLGLFDLSPAADAPVRFSFGADHPHFAGHFPDQAILPGVVQLQELAMPAIQARWPDLGVLTRVPQIKFKRPVRPGDAIEVSLSRQDVTVRYELRANGAVSSTATLVFDGAA